MLKIKKSLIAVIVLLISFASLSFYGAAGLKMAAADANLISDIPELSVSSPMEKVSIEGLSSQNIKMPDSAPDENEPEKPQETDEDKPKEDKSSKDANPSDKKDKNDKSVKKDKNDKKDKDGGKENAGKDDKSEKTDDDETEFTEDPADIFVEDTITVSSLLDEIGIDDEEKIIYVKCITGVGSDAAVQAANGIYSLLLSTTGTTIIQIKYVDNDGNTKTHVKKIDYERPEGATPKGKEPLINTNLKDMGEYNNPIVNLDVWLTDYKGKPLAYNNAEVKVNGERADYVGEMDRQTYRTTLRAGSNEIEIKIKDKYQYTVKKTYTLYYKSGKGTAIMSLEGGTIGKKYFIEPTEVEIEPGVALSHALVDFLEAHGYKCSYAGSLDDGFYLAKVSKKNMIKGYKIPDKLKEFIIEDAILFDENNYESLDCLGEFDFSQGSGWMYSINGLYSSYGFNNAYVQDKDVVRVRFTLAYGKDIAGYEVVSGTYGRLGKYDGEW